MPEINVGDVIGIHDVELYALTEGVIFEVVVIDGDQWGLKIISLPSIYRVGDAFPLNVSTLEQMEYGTVFEVGDGAIRFTCDEENKCWYDHLAAYYGSEDILDSTSYTTGILRLLPFGMEKWTVTQND